MSHGDLLNVYRGLGRLAGYAVVARLGGRPEWPVTFPRRLSAPLLRALCDVPLSLSSLSEVDAPFAAGFVEYLRKTPIAEWEEVVGSSLRWTTGVAGEAERGRSLRWFGAWQRVTEEGKREYLARFIRSRMEEVPSPFLTAMRSGLRDVLPALDNAKLHFVALGELISGPIVGAISGEEIEAAITIDTVSPTGEQALRRVLLSLSPDEAAAFLQFTTGSRFPPPAGLASLSPPLNARLPLLGPHGLLPTAATCFHSLTLSPPHTESSIASRLRTALTFGARGFSFV
jgi:hypothetical protein